MSENVIKRVGSGTILRFEYRYDTNSSEKKNFSPKWVYLGSKKCVKTHKIVCKNEII